MARPYRVLAVGVLGTLVVAGGSVFLAPAADDAPPPPPARLPVAYAAPAEVRETLTLAPGESLGQLLDRADLDAAEARRLLDELQAVSDPRRLRAGTQLQMARSTRTGRTRQLEMKLDADRTLRLDGRGGELVARVEEVPVRVDTAALVGEVRGSLYGALLRLPGEVSREERMRIVDELADRVFAWKIDFSRDLKVGDSYRILYERLVRPDGTARSGRVLAVRFELSGRLHEAYRFEVNGREDWYDGEGESLRRAFLRAPLEFRRISSSFSTGRFHPILRRVRAHNGIDYAAAPGTPVRAVGDGVIRRAGWGGGYGNLVEISHQRGYASRYAHLRGFARGILPGVRVKQGDLIGYVGSTGLSTGPHLHYEFHSNGRPVNPADVRYLSGDPVPASHRAAFRATVAARVAAFGGEGPALARNDGR